MNKQLVAVLGLVCLLAIACGTQKRSISHSEYRAEQSFCAGPRVTDAASDPALEYKGELSEFDVLGITRGEFASDADIRRALDAAKQLKVPPGSTLLLIQSGALMPDGGMVTELARNYRVVPFSGVPTQRHSGSLPSQTESADPESYSRSLRLIAARGGADFIVCYWGTLESENDRLPTKTVSWVPLMNWILPDEKQHMRIQLRVAIVDVRSGTWSVFSPEPIKDARLTTPARKGTVDQKQVERLKQLAYEASARELEQKY